MHAHTSLLMCSSFFNYGAAAPEGAAAAPADEDATNYCTMYDVLVASRRRRSEAEGPTLPRDMSCVWNATRIQKTCQLCQL